MIRVMKLLVVGVTSLLVITVGSLLLFWLGRTQTPAEIVFGDGEDLYDEEDTDED